MTYEEIYDEEYNKEKERLAIIKAKQDAIRDANRKPRFVRVLNWIIKVIKGLLK